MSRTSKVNPTLRSNIIESLNLAVKTNNGLYLSGIANSGAKFSLRAIQEATQKLVAEGTLVAFTYNGKIYLKNADVAPVNTVTAVGALAAMAAVATVPAV